MKVKRIVSDIHTEDPGKADQFYKDIFGLDVFNGFGPGPYLWQ